MTASHLPSRFDLFLALSQSGTHASTCAEGNVNAAGIDADHRCRRAVQNNLAANNPGRFSQRSPQVVAGHHNGRALFVVFAGQKSSADLRPYAESGEETRRYKLRFQPRGLFYARQVHRPASVRRQRLERTRLLPPVVEIGRGNMHYRSAARG